MGNWRDIAGKAMGVAMQTFGEAVAYAHAGGGSATITAVFEESYEGVDPDTGAIVQTEQPRLSVRLSDLPDEPVAGDTFVPENGKTYRVHRVERDAEGGAVLYSFEV